MVLVKYHIWLIHQLIYIVLPYNTTFKETEEIDAYLETSFQLQHLVQVFQAR